MSDELEWELIELFDSGLFAFPIWEHNMARRIVRTLLRRGVLVEEVSDAIEESTADFDLWLNHGGKHMVGEWLIAWMNECQEEYMKAQELEGSHLMTISEESFLIIDSTHDSISSNSQNGDTYHQAIQEPTADFVDVENGNTSLPRNTRDQDSQENNNDLDSENMPSTSGEPSPPPLPPRTLPRKKLVTISEIKECPPAKQEEELKVLAIARYEDLYEKTVDLGPMSPLYSYIPSQQRILFRVNAPQKEQQLGPDNNNYKDDNYKTQDAYTCETRGDEVVEEEEEEEECTLGPFCDNCQCRLSHYSIIQHVQPMKHDRYCERFMGDAALRAMDFNLQTLDKDGPGFIYIMTNSNNRSLPWSIEQPYKVSSSRHPDQCLTEFRSRNIDIELIWQVKVEQHLSAIREIHNCLYRYNIRSNWFKCSLTILMDAVSSVSKKYRS